MIYKKIVASVFAMAISGVAMGASFIEGDDYALTGAPAASNSAKVQITEFFGYWCPHCNNFEPMLEKWVEEKAGAVSFSRVPIAFSKRGSNQVLAQKAYYIGQQTRKEKAVDHTMFDFYHKYARLGASFGDIDKLKADPVACNAEINSLVDQASKKNNNEQRPFDVAGVTKYLNETVCEADNQGWELLKLGKSSRGNIVNDEVLENILATAGVDTSNFDKLLNSFSMKSAMKMADNKMEKMGIQSVPTIVVNDKYRVSSAKGFDHMLKVVEFLIEKEQAEINK